MPVMMRGQGTSGSAAFQALTAFIFAGSAWTMYWMPSRIPLPPVWEASAARPRKGTISPPTINPMPLMVSDTATAFSPPKMA